MISLEEYKLSYMGLDVIFYKILRDDVFTRITISRELTKDEPSLVKYLTEEGFSADEVEQVKLLADSVRNAAV